MRKAAKENTDGNVKDESRETSPETPDPVTPPSEGYWDTTDSEVRFVATPSAHEYICFIYLLRA